MDGSGADLGDLRPALELVADEFRDPVSAQFRRLRLSEKKWKDPSRKVYCGEVNAKNAMGGYVGFTPFVVVPAEKSATVLPARSDVLFDLKCLNLEFSGCIVKCPPHRR